MIFLKLFIMLSLLILLYTVLSGLNKTDKKIIKEISWMQGDKGGESNWSIKGNFKKLPFVMTEEELNQMGDPFPFHVNYIGYIFLKIACAVLFFIGLYGRAGNVYVAILGIPLGFWVIDWIYKRSNKNELDLVRLDLEDVYNSLRFNVRSGETLGDALTNVSSVVKRSKRLKVQLIKLAAEINLTANIEKALLSFGKQFNYDEIKLFVQCIQQSLVTGIFDNVLEGQATQLSRKNEQYRERKNEGIDKEMLIWAMLYFLGAMAIIFILMTSHIGDAMNQIFK